VPLLILRDFDKAGFSIAGTLRRSTRRYSYGRSFDVRDLGLRLADVEKYGLEPEDCNVGADPGPNLRRNGATAAEVAFLAEGKRVELNAFTSGVFLEWVESKLDENGVKKVVPDAETVEAAYRRAAHRALLLDGFRKLDAEIAEKVGRLAVPEDLRRRIEGALRDDRPLPWDEALAEIVADHLGVDHQADEDARDEPVRDEEE
jgi:hypothetical protein